MSVCGVREGVSTLHPGDPPPTASLAVPCPRVSVSLYPPHLWLWTLTEETCLFLGRRQCTSLRGCGAIPGQASSVSVWDISWQAGHCAQPSWEGQGDGEAQGQACLSLCENPGWLLPALPAQSHPQAVQCKSAERREPAGHGERDKCQGGDTDRPYHTSQPVARSPLDTHMPSSGLLSPRLGLRRCPGSSVASWARPDYNGHCLRQGPQELGFDSQGVSNFGFLQICHLGCGMRAG